MANPENADLESLQAARQLLQDLVERDPSLNSRSVDGSSIAAYDAASDLLERRLERAAAENREAVALGLTPASESDRRAEVVREILQRDLVADPGSLPGGRMISECDELILSERAVNELLYENFVRRRYVIRDAAGRELGELQQMANPSRLDVSRSSPLTQSDFHFHVLDRTTGQTFSFERVGDQLYVLDEVDSQLGFVHFKAGARPASFKVISCIDRGMLQVKPAPDAPFLLRIVGNFGDEIGMIERRYVGLGPFFEDGNQMRIRADGRFVSPGHRWGLVATALLAGVDDELSSQASSGS